MPVADGNSASVGCDPMTVAMALLVVPKSRPTEPEGENSIALSSGRASRNLDVAFAVGHKLLDRGHEGAELWHEPAWAYHVRMRIILLAGFVALFR